MFITQILYNQKNFLKSQENFLSDLAPHMLTHDVWDKLKNSTQEIKIAAAPIEQITFYKNSIFWSIYFAVNGGENPKKLGINMTNLLMNEKKSISDYFNNNSASLKNSNHKLTLAKINEIKCNLMTKPFMDDVESCIPLSIYYKRPIYIYFEEIHSYMRFVDKNYVCDDDDAVDPNIILLFAKDNRVILEPDVASFMKTIDSLFCIQHYEKILSGVSTYKTDEIREIYKIVFGKDDNLKKPEYYERVLVKCSTYNNSINS